MRHISAVEKSSQMRPFLAAYATVFNRISVYFRDTAVFFSIRIGENMRIQYKYATVFILKTHKCDCPNPIFVETLKKGQGIHHIWSESKPLLFPSWAGAGQIPQKCSFFFLSKTSLEMDSRSCFLI